MLLIDTQQTYTSNTAGISDNAIGTATGTGSTRTWTSQIVNLNNTPTNQMFLQIAGLPTTPAATPATVKVMIRLDKELPFYEIEQSQLDGSEDGIFAVLTPTFCDIMITVNDVPVPTSAQTVSTTRYRVAISHGGLN